MSHTQTTITNNSSSQNISSQKQKLRMLFKERGSCKSILNHCNEDSKNSSESLLSNNPENVKSIGMNGLCTNVHIVNPEQKTNRFLLNSSLSQNTIKRLETLSREEELMGKSKSNKLDCVEELNRMMVEITDLELKAEDLIHRKIKKISRKSTFITLKDKGDDEISSSIEAIINKVNRLKSEHLLKLGASQRQTKIFIDKKIQLLEKLMASKSAEAELLKQHFFAINAINHQKKVSKSFRTLVEKSNMTPLKFRTITEKVESVCKQSENQIQFTAPKEDEYEHFRHKSKEYVENKQPFPRSSYNREYLLPPPQTLEKSYKNFDSLNTVVNRKIEPSTYSKDYKKERSERINFKDLDSYQDKYKNIEISYALDHRKEDSNKFIEASQRYFDDQSKQKKERSITEGIEEKPANPRYNRKLIMRTESTVQYEGEQQIHNSSIKHKNLNNLKYEYRNLGNN